ncbi:MAG TPA: extracellular solute-binding protein [Phototrophicaceae bacterium]|nr:extracellular solute-binding protein [Phototrophicaceae bacterium]
MLKKISAFILLLTLALSFSIVAAQDDPLTDVDPTGQTIVYWHEWNGAQSEAINAIIDDFNKTNEYGITVTTVEQGNSGAMFDAMTAGITSGQLPNLVGGFANNAQSWYLDGVTVALDPYLNSPKWGFTDEEKADINFDLIDAYNRIPGEPFNDQLLAWPIGLSANVLSVNLGMLEALGIDSAPATFDDFRAASCAAAEYTGPKGEDVQGFPIRTTPDDMVSFIVSNGGYVWDDATSQFNFTNEKAIETFQFFADLYKDGCAYVPDGPFVNTADFAASLNPMAVGSTAGAPFINGDAVKANDAGGTGVSNWTNTITPYSDDNKTLVAFFRGVVLISGTPEQNLATWLFIKHLASTASQVTWTEKTSYFPYTASGLAGLSEEFLTANPQFSSVRDLLLDDTVAIYSTPQLLGAREGLAEMSNLITNITTGGQDVATAAAESEAAANEKLADGQSALQ